MRFIQLFNTIQAWSNSQDTQHAVYIHRNPYQFNMNIHFSNLNSNLKIKQSFWNSSKTGFAQLWPKSKETWISENISAVALNQQNTITQVHTHTCSALTVLLGPEELWTLHLQCRKFDCSPAAWERKKTERKCLKFFCLLNDYRNMVIYSQKHCSLLINNINLSLSCSSICLSFLSLILLSQSFFLSPPITVVDFAASSLCLLCSPPLLSTCTAHSSYLCVCVCDGQSAWASH